VTHVSRVFSCVLWIVVCHSVISLCEIPVDLHRRGPMHSMIGLATYNRVALRWFREDWIED